MDITYRGHTLKEVCQDGQNSVWHFTPKGGMATLVVECDLTDIKELVDDYELAKCRRKLT